MEIGDRNLFIDLGAERLLIAERGFQKIAVEVKSFISPSPVKDFENALGQYILYEDLLTQEDLERILYDSWDIDCDRLRPECNRFDTQYHGQRSCRDRQR